MWSEIGNWRHVCVDMQRIFWEDTPWHAPSIREVLPQVIELASFYPERTIFTRFIPPNSADQAFGAWQDYYQKWWMMTRDQMPAEQLRLVPSLAALVPPAQLLDKHIYSPWLETKLHQTLRSWEVSTLVISGGETDVCVLATVIGAIDFGYRVIVMSDAVYSGDDSSYGPAMELFARRFSVQLSMMPTEDLLRQASQQPRKYYS